MKLARTYNVNVLAHISTNLTDLAPEEWSMTTCDTQTNKVASKITTTYW